LQRVVLYRNGIGYFERTGTVDGNQLTLKVRKDQVNDLLKSLTVVERSGGKAVSVSMPLDPQTWANAALATLAPGRGSLAEVLDALRGTEVTLNTTAGTLSGRILMVERIEEEPDPIMPRGSAGGQGGPPALGVDHKVTLIAGSEMNVVRLSKVKQITLEDGDLAMQFNRSLDATAGEGMFQQVDVVIRLAEHRAHEVMVSYVVAAPMWKPTYRVVLPKEGKGKALLQGWAVIDNTSGEDWGDVELSLTSGAPIAFRYDLHTPRNVPRSDLTESGVRKRARVAVGETTFTEEEREEAEGEADGRYDEDGDDSAYPSRPSVESKVVSRKPKPRKMRMKKEMDVLADESGDAPGGGGYGYGKGGRGVGRLAAATEAPKPQAIDFNSLRRSTQASARASQVSGLTRFDIDGEVTIPEGTSTMVAIVNHEVEAEETFLFKPGGAGVGYDQNPYRVVRFKNTTPFVLESGPISIYAGGSFVGEGLSEAVGTGTSATIPFAVEPNILVSSTAKRDGDEMRLIRIVRGVLEVEAFARTTTTWTVKGRAKKEGFSVLIRHPKAGWNYELSVRPDGTEDLPGAYLVPVVVPAGKREASLKLIEQTPSKTSISIWDGKAIPLLESLLLSTNLLPEARGKLEPIVTRRQEIGRIDTQISGLKKQQHELDDRADQTRQNLEAIKKDAQAGGLRARLNKRLDDFTKEGDRIGREVVELSSKRLEKKIELEDLLQNLDLHAPDAKSSKKGATGKK